MQNTKIEFKKDLILKTYIGVVTDISLTHDYKINEDTLEGYFDVSGSYKITSSSLDNEDFLFTIPFTIALSSLIDKDTINLTINDFNYTTEKDTLHLNITLEMAYDETKEVETEIDNFIEENIPIIEPQPKVNITETPTTIVEDNSTNLINNITNNSYSKYKVYIMRDSDTTESILLKYNITLEDLKQYNNIDSIKVGDKLVIPIYE